MKRSAAAIIGIPVGVVIMMCGVIVGIPLMYFGTASGCTTMGGTIPIDGAEVKFGDWEGPQVANAAAILQQGQKQNIPVYGWQIALATAMQESTLRVLANPSVPESYEYPHDGEGEDHDSVGLFQQRPNWGTVQERMTPATSARLFFDALMAVDGWPRMSLTEAAQVVQRSAFPDAYAKWETPAAELMEFLTGHDLDELLQDRSGVCDPAVVGAQGWVAPVSAPISSTYLDPARDGEHFGVDLAAERGTPIYAAADGFVLIAECDADTSVECDVEGSLSTAGCGWYVEIAHGELYSPSSKWVGVATQYCHMQSQPLVTGGELVSAGQVIGYVGNSGNSSGPHLHYGVYQGLNELAYQRPEPATSTDPVAWHEAVEAPLGIVDDD